MKFERLNKHAVRTTSGVEVHAKGEHSVCYIDGKRNIDIYVEYGYIGSPAIVAHKREFLKWSNGVALTELELAEVIEIYTEANKSMGLIVQIHE